MNKYAFLVIPIGYANSQPKDVSKSGETSRCYGAHQQALYDNVHRSGSVEHGRFESSVTHEELKKWLLVVRNSCKMKLSSD